jgi:hypothetical protein
VISREVVVRVRFSSRVQVSRGRVRLLVAVLLTVLLSVAGIGIAAWLVSGSGTGAATAGTASPLNIASGTPVDSLYPGGSASVAVIVTNPNPFPVELTEFHLNGTITSNVSECDSGGHAVTFATQAGTWGVEANGSSSIQLAGAASMGVDSAAACQGAGFTIPLGAVASSGTSSTPSTTTPSTDADGDGWTVADGDCDDSNLNVNPGAIDSAYEDLNCDGTLDSDGDGLDNWFEGVAIDDGDPTTVDLHRDTDGDTVPDYLDLDSDDDGVLDAEDADPYDPTLS